MFFITGTKAYGPFREGSDIDVVMMKDKARFLRELLYLVPGAIIVEDKEGLSHGDGFYFKIRDVVINVITIYTKRHYAAWQRVTGKMRRRPEIEDKAERVKCFKKLLAEEYADLDDIPF